MFDNDKFLTDILAAIEDKHTSAAEVCKLLGMNPAAVNSLKRGQTPTVPAFLKLVQWAGLCAMDYLVDPQSEEYQINPRQLAKTHTRLFIAQVLKIGISRNINAYGVANETGIKPSTLSRMKSHGTVPSPETIDKLSKWSGLDASHYFTTTPAGEHA
jgi:transcriptional regulator with XRE-family HTH domain